jgi:hypothetical protein
VGSSRLELLTFCVSSRRSNQLSYDPARRIVPHFRRTGQTGAERKAARTARKIRAFGQAS